MEKIEFFEQMLAQQRGNSEHKSSYTNAQWALADAYDWARITGYEMIVIKSVLWDGFPEEMSQLLADLNVRRICIAYCGNSLLERLSEFCKCGWKLKEVADVPATRIEGEVYCAPGIILERNIDSFLTIQLIRERQCENERWHNTVYVTLTKEEELEFKRVTEQDREGWTTSLLLKRISTDLASLEGWKKICQASNDFNWGDAMMELPLGGMSFDKPLSANGLDDILLTVNQDALLAPTSVPALYCIKHSDGKVASMPSFVDFQSGDICVNCDAPIQKDDQVYVLLENGDRIDCDSEEDFMRLLMTRTFCD